VNPQRRALVTGATGFIGRRLVDRLRDEGWSVRALLRTPSTGSWDDSVVVDLATGAVPANAVRDVDAVFHLAGKAHAVEAVGESDADYAVNVVGTTALLEAACAEGVEYFVFVSSVKAATPDSPYGWSKRRAEEAVLATRPGPGPRVCVVRPVLVYGPGNKGNLERMMNAIDRRRFPPLADPGNRRSMVHVLDLVDALLLCATSNAADGRTYVVTDGHGYSTRTLYVEMSRALGRPVPSWTVPLGVLRAAGRVGDVVGRLTGRRAPLDSTGVERLVESAEYDGEAVCRELGFRPVQDLRAALPEMVAAYRADRPQ
jgi:UDP-glucose 4-epimerase